MNSTDYQMTDEGNSGGDICRVCRCEGQPDRPLFHPCICTGSIKWIHQECLMQWMRYSRKEYCELCSHRFSFTPIYAADMPRRLLLKDVAAGLMSSLATALKCWFHYSMVSLAWLGFVPITSYRIYRCLFSGSVESFLSLPWDLTSLENIPSDVFHGCFVVTCTLFSFIGIVWLREQIVNSGPDWLRPPNQHLNNNHLDQPQPVEQEAEGIAQAAADPAMQVPGEVVEPNVNDNNVINNNAANQQEVREDEINWNPIEWDRAAEELTWERLLGLDGSLLFVEHVFWVVSLNTLFIIIFALCPYHLGQLVTVLLNREEQVANSHFAGLITTVAGYFAIAILLITLHYIAAFFGLRRAQRILGLCYVIIKVALLSIIEIGVLPLICGWWLDICSLSLFDATLKDRDNSYHLAPGTSIFIHWLIGMVYVYYFASFILLLREVLRPGVLWFMVNLNDPDFSPMQEMIHLSIVRHIRRLLASSVIFGTAVLLMLWVPIKILRFLWPTFLPYTVAVQSETATSELSLELLLLQVILPALLEQSHTRVWMKSLVHMWCRWVSWLLGIHSYLLGDEAQNQQQQQNNPNNNNANNEPIFNALGAAHQALLPRDGRIGVQPYQRPSWFYLRITGLLTAVAVSLVLASVTVLTLPVWLGRRMMALWLVGGVPAPSPPVIAPTITSAMSPPLLTGATSTTSDTATVNVHSVHELYTAACGAYLCWLCARAVGLLRSWLPQGRAAMAARCRQWAIWGTKSLVTFSLLLGLIPLLFGILLELVVVIPLRVPLEQTPVFFVWQDWALGVLYTKIACAVILMGPEWSIRRAIERVYRDGVRNMDLIFIITQVAVPVTTFLGLCLAIPYVTAHTLVPMFVTSPHLRNLVARRLYPSLLLAAIVVVIIAIQIRQFRKLYERIKNDKYLVEKRLVNYHHRHHHGGKQRAGTR